VDKEISRVALYITVEMLFKQGLFVSALCLSTLAIGLLANKGVIFSKATFDEFCLNILLAEV
jgi:hypothetical protein